MSIRRECPCDIDGICPYESESWRTCEYWCGSDEPSDYPDIWEEEEEGTGALLPF